MNLPFRITNKTYMGLILFILTVIGIVYNGISKTLPQLIIATATTIILDLIINYIKDKRIILPDSATISGLFIATTLSIGQPWYIPLIAGIIAIASKHLIKINNKHIFNPAVFGLFFVMLVFSSRFEWWAAKVILLVIILGLLLTWKMKRFHLILSYLITSLIISITYNLITKQGLNIGTIFFSTNLFFMFFMLVEPITSPITKKGRIIYGILTAIFSFMVLLIIPKYEPSIVGLLIADLFVPWLNKYTITKSSV